MAKTNEPPEPFLVEGAGVVEDFLRRAPEQVIEVGSSERQRDSVDSLARKYQFKQASAQAQSQSRSPIWAKVRVDPIDDVELFRRLAGEKRALLMAATHITDPRNLGAIVRSAAFFGVPYLIVAKDRQAPVTQATVSTSQAGFACTQLVVVTNLNRTLNKLKDLGYWLLGADMAGEPVSRLTGFYEQACLVMGAEDKGLPKQVRTSCDRLVGITPAQGAGIDSLNVSVAAGILLSHLTPAG